MPRDAYQEELAALREEVVEFGGTVSARLEDAVIDGDEEINERYLELESRCVDLFALQQPVAGDLRFVTASFKIITEHERLAATVVERDDELDGLCERVAETVVRDLVETTETFDGEEMQRLLTE